MYGNNPMFSLSVFIGVHLWLIVLDTSGFNKIKIDNGCFYLFKKDIPDVFVCGRSTWAGKYLVVDAIPGKKLPDGFSCKRMKLNDPRWSRGVSHMGNVG